MDSLPDRAGASRTIRQARQVADRISAAATRVRGGEAEVVEAHAVLVRGLVRADLDARPLTALTDLTDGRIPLAALGRAGYRTVGQLSGLDQRQLREVPGVGALTARAVAAAVESLASATAENVRLRIDLDRTNPAATRLLVALARQEELRRAVGGAFADLAELGLRFTAELAAAAPVANPFRWRLTGRGRRVLALEAAVRLADLIGVASRGPADRAAAVLAVEAGLRDPWPDFERRAGDYYALLSEFVTTTVPTEAGQGYLTEEVVARVKAQELDDRFRTVVLRQYQSFGARFALAQRRVILGDEMGLGKTIQALAAIAHLRTLTQGPVLVVCPASVMVNWQHEVLARTRLGAVVIHGSDRQEEVADWLSGPDLGVTTFETLQRLGLPTELQLAALVVDEAHYVKNPRAGRSQEVRRLAAQSDHVWFLTGTPMENDVEELRQLVRYLQSDLVPVDASAATAGPAVFRRSLSPVYLRRNAEDVLVELPSRQDTDEWVAMTAADREVYRAAVESGDFMGMRRAGFHSADPGRCAKAARLGELLKEALANQRKVIVYSFFRDVLARAGLVAGGTAFGPLDGSVDPARRQDLVDAFSRHRGPAALLAQVRAGGVGLNLQAASVVILCEPQLNPAVEDQAIGRAHRMGQVRPVQVHRLLCSDGVDVRLVEMLATKRADFDRYARRSALAEATLSAVDLSLGDLAEELVRSERTRLELR